MPPQRNHGLGNCHARSIALRDLQVGLVEGALGTNITTGAAVTALRAEIPIDGVDQVDPATRLHEIEEALITERIADRIRGWFKDGKGALVKRIPLAGRDRPRVKDVIVRARGDAIVHETRTTVGTREGIAGSSAHAHCPEAESVVSCHVGGSKLGNARGKLTCGPAPTSFDDEHLGMLRQTSCHHSAPIARSYDDNVIHKTNVSHRKIGGVCGNSGRSAGANRATDVRSLAGERRGGLVVVLVRVALCGAAGLWCSSMRPFEEPPGYRPCCWLQAHAVVALGDFVASSPLARAQRPLEGLAFYAIRYVRRGVSLASEVGIAASGRAFVRELPSRIFMILFEKRLLVFARRLHAIEDFDEMVKAVGVEIQESTGYNMAWLAIFDLPKNRVRVLAAKGNIEEDFLTHTSVMPFADDPYLMRMFEATEPQIIRDAQIDPNVNREIVEQLGNRTLINIPIRLVDQQFGSLGTGTFGDEGVRMPSDEELAHLVGISEQLVTASARLVLKKEREEAAERLELFDRKLAERQKVESLGELAGGIAHDFNNLLMVVISSASLLLDAETDPQREADLQSILDASARASELTRRLLALGKRQSLQYETASLNTLVDSVVSMLKRLIPADIVLDIVLAEDLPLVSMDTGQIEQVLLNLALNAKDAMPNGGRLALETEHVDIDREFVREHPWAQFGRYALLTATDTGRGMTPDVLKKVFVPFYTTKSSCNGSGLGLSVCRGIIEQHAGFIHGESKLGVGTTFKIYLPIGERPAAAVGTELVSPTLGGTERLLFADDEEQVRRVVKRILEKAGYSVVAVSDGALALKAALSEDFDLVILDVVMPIMGGRAAFDALRSHNPQLPVLFASGYGADELSARFLADIDVPLLAKPFTPDSLLRMVRNMLDGTI